MTIKSGFMTKCAFSLSKLVVLLLLLMACSKKKDDNPAVVPPGNNNNNPNPVDSNSTPPPPPKFLDFSPATAFIGDTVSITGENLDANPNSISIRFGGVDATIAGTSKTTLKVIVPDDIEASTSKIALQVSDTTLSIEKQFQLKASVIASISLTTGLPGQQIQIQGKGFRNSYKFNQVTFGDHSIDKGATKPGNSTLTIRVPQNMKSGKYPVSVTVAGMTTKAADSFVVITPVITSITPASGTTYGEMTIKGENFVDINGGHTSVYFVDWLTGRSSTVALIKSITKNEIKVTIPNLQAGDYKISIMVVEGEVSSSTPFTVTE